MYGGYISCGLVLPTTYVTCNMLYICTSETYPFPRIVENFFFNVAARVLYFSGKRDIMGQKYLNYADAPTLKFLTFVTAIFCARKKIIKSENNT